MAMSDCCIWYPLVKECAEGSINVLMRSSVYGRMTMMTPSAITTPSAIIPKSRHGAPAAKYIIVPVARMRSAVEVFGCASKRALGRASITTKGNSPFFGFASWRACGASHHARTSTKPIFKNSDGCTVVKPRSIQRVAPPEWNPIPGTKTSAVKRIVAA